MTPAFEPIAPWWIVAAVGAVVVALTLWAYAKRLRGSEGRWRWIALGLRLAAIVLCILAALRPSLLVMQKVKQTAAVVFLLDGSTSMTLTDEAGGESRWQAARRTLDTALAGLKTASKPSLTGPGTKLEVKAQTFDAKLGEYKPKDPVDPKGRETALGTALEEAIKLAGGTRIISIVLLSDGASNAGISPLASAQRLKSLQIPVVAVGFGSESVGRNSRDLAARDVVAGPVVFVKNKVNVRGTIAARGFPPGEPIDVELFVEDEKLPVKTQQIKLKPGESVVALPPIEWTPQRIGETKLTLRVKPKDGEQVPTNNAISTYVTVQKGGLAVLYLQGPNFSWEPRYLTWALDAAQEIQADLKVLRRPAGEDPNALPDADLAPGRYDVIILGDLPANFLTPVQQQLIARSVQQNGTGLMMLGGRSSFGLGGWAATPLANVLPTEMHPGDGQVEPPNGLRVLPNASGLDSFVLKLASSRGENARIWQSLPPISGANRLGRAKPAALVLASQSDGEPLMVGQDVGKGRVLAFGGETWPWYRVEEGRNAHRRFWRQAIFWLAHKEDKGESLVRVALDRRRVSQGQKLDLTATARDEKNEPIPGVRFETKVESLGNGVPAAEKVDLFNNGTNFRGNYVPLGKPGEYRVTVKALREDKELGSDNARFLVYQDDRELDNPAADHALLRQIAQITGGQTSAPEQLGKYLKTLDGETLTETATQREVRLWDNWPFFLVFAGLLTVEWWLRKRNGWV